VKESIEKEFAEAMKRPVPDETLTRAFEDREPDRSQIGESPPIRLPRRRDVLLPSKGELP
jgi:hypothetical protein